VFEAVTVVAGFDDMAVMGQPVQQGRAQQLMTIAGAAMYQDKHHRPNHS
jgi:hypothetical protein